MTTQHKESSMHKNLALFDLDHTLLPLDSDRPGAASSRGSAGGKTTHTWR